jgi:hypothetical protein
MDLIIVKNLKECEILWNKYSPNEHLWDLWEVASSFFNSEIHEPYFMVLTDENKEIGLLPLVYCSKINKYYYFSGSLTFPIKLWFNKTKLKEVYNLLPSPCKLYDINHNEIVENVGEISDDYRYFINTKDMIDINDYLKTFSKKHRYNLLSDLKKLFDIRLEWTKKINLEKIKEFNVSRFGHESDFSDKEMYDEFIKFINTTEKYIYCLNVYKENELVGLEFAIFFKNKYYIINGGYDKSIKNLGKLLIFEHIKKGFELKANEIDFLVGDTGWKELWNLDKEKVITIKKL